LSLLCDQFCGGACGVVVAGSAGLRVGEVVSFTSLPGIVDDGVPVVVDGDVVVVSWPVGMPESVPVVPDGEVVVLGEVVPDCGELGAVWAMATAGSARAAAAAIAKIFTSSLLWFYDCGELNA
jgi:hypothetical protein